MRHSGIFQYQADNTLDTRKRFKGRKLAPLRFAVCDDICGSSICRGSRALPPSRQAFLRTRPLSKLPCRHIDIMQPCAYHTKSSK